MVLCGEIPFEFTEQRAQCCAQARPAPLPPAAAAAVATARASRKGISARYALVRPDLDTGSAFYTTPPQYLFGECTTQLVAQVPTFAKDANNVTVTTYVGQPVPQLSKSTVYRVKQRAITVATSALRSRYRAVRRLNALSGIQHPAGFVGAAEVAAIQARVKAGVQPQAAALESLLTGNGVVPKVYAGGWSFRTDTPAGDYGGVMPMAKFEADWGGVAVDDTTCPSNYPAGAPRSLCGHIALVEIDAQMAYKQAAAYAANKNTAHAQQAIRALTSWASTNAVFGLRHRNGPLEAAWAVGAMARAAELLRTTRYSGYTSTVHSQVTGWMRRVLLPQMDWYQYTITPTAIANGRLNVYGNWQASIADAKMAFGALTDNRTLYDQGVALYRTTVADSFKWGRGAYAAGGRLVGESSETLRDIYHTEFGLASLLQAAETAWAAQDEDVFGESGYVLAAAVELHARIINAGLANDPSLLPAGFKFYDGGMPKAPGGCAWQWSIDTQRWASFNRTGGAKCSDLDDGVKYILGVTYIPSWAEIAYNHYVGRLGMRLPETAKLLARNPIDWYTFSWGLGTLSHADTAKELWRPGVGRSTLCARRGSR